jgi:hypothetical protein
MWSCAGHAMERKDLDISCFEQDAEMLMLEIGELAPNP